MIYTIVESFSPADGEKWRGYCEFRGFQFERFDSIDGLLRPPLFRVPGDDEWDYVVNEDFMIHYLTDLGFAVKKQKEIGKGELVGLTFEEHDPKHPGFLGFDIIDGGCDISLLTNWGCGEPLINEKLASNALVPELSAAQSIWDELQQRCPDEDHVKGSRIVAIYDPWA